METEPSKKDRPENANHDRNRQVGDILIGAVFIVFSILMIIGALHFPSRARMGMITSAGFTPVLLSILVIILGFVLILVTLRKYGKVSIPDWFRGVIADEGVRRSFVLIAIIGVYIFLIGRVHFVVVNILYLLVMYWYLKIGSWIKIILYGVASALFIAVVVPYIFQMPLP